MFRIRTLIIIILIGTTVYWLLPDRRKRRIRDKLREAWFATIVALGLYWAFMLAVAAWKRWGGS
jgi:uncharacterized BrkB/YihY/UPF0761 family membrane protein